jgi:hypothetical protein
VRFIAILLRKRNGSIVRAVDVVPAAGEVVMSDPLQRNEVGAESVNDPTLAVEPDGTCRENGGLPRN